MNLKSDQKEYFASGSYFSMLTESGSLGGGVEFDNRSGRPPTAPTKHTRKYPTSSFSFCLSNTTIDTRKYGNTSFPFSLPSSPTRMQITINQLNCIQSISTNKYFLPHLWNMPLQSQMACLSAFIFSTINWIEVWLKTCKWRQTIINMRLFNQKTVIQ